MYACDYVWQEGQMAMYARVCVYVFMYVRVFMYVCVYFFFID